MHSHGMSYYLRNLLAVPPTGWWAEIGYVYVYGAVFLYSPGELKEILWKCHSARTMLVFRLPNSFLNNVSTVNYIINLI